MTDTNIYTFDNLKPGEELYETLRKSLSAKVMVPVIGSGFTKGAKASKGEVPGVEELCDALSKLLIGFYERGESDLDDSDIQDILCMKDNRNLEGLAGTVQACISRDNSKKLLNEVRTYINDNFTGVNNISNAKRRFLRIGWEYLYTLNYDDAIESTLSASSGSLDIAIPYKNFDKPWLISNNRKCIIKLHGDAKEFVETGDTKDLILTSSQYLELIGSEKNQQLTNGLRDDFCSKTMLFVGCSLSNELDLLFAKLGGLGNLSAVSSANSIYVFYDEKPDKKIDLETRIRLGNYGVKTILRLTPNELDKFYSFMAELSSETNKVNSEDALIEFTDYSFTKIPADNVEANIRMLYTNGNLIDSGKKRITFPSFLFKRDIEDKIIKSVEANTTINIILGNRFSGKTYILLRLFNHFAKKTSRTYYISGAELSERIFPILYRKKNCVFIFDAGTVSFTQLKSQLVRNIDNLSRNNNKVIIVIDSADRDSIMYLVRQQRMQNRKIEKFIVDNKLTDTELNSFNYLVGKLLLFDRKRHETFYDYLIRLDDARLNVDGCFFSNNNNIIEYDDIKQIKAMIVLSVFPRLDAHIANLLDISTALERLHSSSSGLIQVDYLSLFQRNHHSGMMYASNSTYWVRRCLSEFAKDSSNFSRIAEAYESIIDSYEFERSCSSSPSREYVFNNAIGPYINLDIMQEVFFSGTDAGGSLVLPKVVFQRLAPKLPNRYQFLHQYAKCLLRLSRRNNEGNQRFEYLRIAKDCIERAISLALDSSGDHVSESVAHMAVTKSLVFARFLRLKTEYGQVIDSVILKRAVESFTDIYFKYEPIVSSFTASVDDDHDIKWFINQLSTTWMHLVKTDSYLAESSQKLIQKVYPRATISIKDKSRRCKQ